MSSQMNASRSVQRAHRRYPSAGWRLWAPANAASRPVLVTSAAALVMVTVVLTACRPSRQPTVAWRPARAGGTPLAELAPSEAQLATVGLPPQTPGRSGAEAATGTPAEASGSTGPGPGPSAVGTSAVGSSPQIANPASEYCVQQGGALAIEKRGDGAEFGICVFEDNRQCEEWALLRGQCPVGGRKVTGYITAAGRYCAITGGDYQVTSPGTDQSEGGRCTLPDGRSCDAWDYYNGRCPASGNTGAATYDDPFAYCRAVGTIDAPDDRYVGPPAPDQILSAMMRQGVLSPGVPPEIQRQFAWRCMDQRLWVCHFGANIPCTSKADTSTAPTAAMREFCTANPQADNIPAYVTGRETVYEWSCRNGQPQAGRQVLTVDPQGYAAEFWVALTP